MGRIVLLKEDFQSFRVGDYPYGPVLGAMGEYHYLPDPGYAGQWHDPTPITWGGVKTWMILERDGAKYIEYSVIKQVPVDSLAVLVAGEAGWSDYAASCRLRLLLSSGEAGLLFRYQNSLCYYGLVLGGGKLRLFRRDQEAVAVLAETDFNYSPDEDYELSVQCRGVALRCLVDGVQRLEAEDGAYPAGRIAIGASAPAQFTAIGVTAEAAVDEGITQERRRRDREIAAERANYPQPLLWKAISLRDFGAGRSIRFGHLTGTAETHVVIAQCQRRIWMDAHARISCLTAMDLNGKVLWQQGEPNPEHAFLTADLPFQVYDIDGDGRDEVILARDFKLMILDGATAQVKNWIPTPRMDRSGYPFDRLNVDAIRLCDLTGKGRPTDILIKDRYKKLWAFNCDLKFLWTYDAPVNTGHFPYTRDVNGDGRDEVFVGYDLVDADGRRIFSLPVHTDHTDEIVIGPIDPDRDEIIGIVCGSEGFILADLQGNLLKKDITGHAQRISVGNYRPDLPGLEICVSTYWGNQGIIYLYDCHGEPLWSEERTNNGNMITPVNWTGDGRDLILLNGNLSRGGMIDGHNRQVVVFPDDGHPDRCAEVIDLTGDCRDEVVLWDEKMMYIYTQDNEMTGPVDCPEKYPHYNASNYRGEYAYRRKSGK